MKRYILPIFFCFIHASWAQNQMSEELEYLGQLQEAFEQNRDSEIIPEAKTSVVKKAEVILPTYQAVLKKGSKVKKLEDEKTWTLQKSIYVKARLQFPGAPYSLLLNKEGKAILATRTENLSSIESVTELYPTTDPTKSYVDSTAFRSINTSYDLETKFSVHLENSDAAYLSRFHSSQESNATSTRMQIESYFLSLLPLDFGLSLSYQTGSFGDERSGVRTSFLGTYFGPVVKAQVYQSEGSSLEVFGKVEKSLSLQSDDGRTKNQFSSNAWSVGADWSTETFLGRFFLGVAYRVQRLSLKESSNAGLEIPSQKESLTGPSIFAGYRFKINL